MKKVLSIAMAVAVVLSLSVTAFADVTGGENHDVNAKVVLDYSLAATVTWGNMNFTYTEADNRWSVAVENDNRVSVTNNSARVSIDVGRVYADDEDNDTIESEVFMPYIFTDHIESFAAGSATGGATDATTRNLQLGSGITPTNSATGWLMFTNAGILNDTGNTGADDLSDSNFTKIGTLTLTISAAE